MKTHLLCALAVAASGLAACDTLTAGHQSAQNDARPAPPPVATAAATPVIPPPPPKPKYVAKPRPAPAAPADGATITVVGLSRGELTKTLGEPAERADRNTGQTWTYRANSCSLEVLFLFDMVRNDMFVIDRKLTGTDGSARGEQQCLQHIRAAHAT